MGDFEVKTCPKCKTKYQRNVKHGRGKSDVCDQCRNKEAK